jgi:hypothetical protein
MHDVFLDRGGSSLQGVSHEVDYRGLCGVQQILTMMMRKRIPTTCQMKYVKLLLLADYFGVQNGLCLLFFLSASFAVFIGA